MAETIQEQRKLAARKILEEEARLAKLTRLAEEEIIAKEKEEGTLVSSPERLREGIGSSGGGALEEIAKFSKQLKSKAEGKNEESILSPQQELRAVTQARPIVVCGPSGVGKGTIINLLMERFPGNQFGFSVSHTTRKPRDYEIDGLHYHFTDIQEMKCEIDNNKFIEFAEVHGNYYGTSFESVRSVQRKGQVCILDIDVQGARNVKRSDLNAYFLFIAPPSMEELERRLRGRGTESEEDIIKRLEDAAGELEYGYEAGNFDRIVINKDLDTAAVEVSSIIMEWYPTLIEDMDINCQLCTIS